MPIRDYIFLIQTNAAVAIVYRYNINLRFWCSVPQVQVPQRGEVILLSSDNEQSKQLQDLKWGWKSRAGNGPARQSKKLHKKIVAIEMINSPKLKAQSGFQSPRLASQAHHLSFNQFIFALCQVEKTKINKKVRHWPIQTKFLNFKNQIRDFQASNLFHD